MNNPIQILISMEDTMTEEKKRGLFANLAKAFASQKEKLTEDTAQYVVQQTAQQEAEAAAAKVEAEKSKAQQQQAAAATAQWQADVRQKAELAAQQARMAAEAAKRAEEAAKAAVVKHVWTREDTYADLAFKYYGSIKEPYWRLIYEHNKKIIGNHPNDIRLGLEIEIPPLPDELKNK
jgi:nucleoid-associated protein YgaU